jgi:hypothetical protein
VVDTLPHRGIQHGFPHAEFTIAIEGRPRDFHPETRKESGIALVLPLQKTAAHNWQIVSKDRIRLHPK